jgi:hypothetical protein
LPPAIHASTSLSMTLPIMVLSTQRSLFKLNVASRDTCFDFAQHDITYYGSIHTTFTFQVKGGMSP